MTVVFESLKGLAVSGLFLDIAKLVVSIIVHCFRAVVNSLCQLAELVVWAVLFTMIFFKISDKMWNFFLRLPSNISLYYVTPN